MDRGREGSRTAGMTTFERAKLLPPDDATIAKLRQTARERGLDFDGDMAPRLFAHPGVLFKNNRYDVIRERLGSMWHLSVRPHDHAQCRSWREFQIIKNQLVGEENEGVELYPAESRLVDTAMQYHIWGVADPGFRFPFGFDDQRFIIDPD